MAKAAWGEKFTCQSCGTRFYDMKKKPPTCPKCDTVFEPEKPKGRRAKAVAPVAEAKAEEKPVVEEATAETEEDEELDEALADDTVDDTLIDDGDEDDDDPAADVVIGVDDDSEDK